MNASNGLLVAKLFGRPVRRKFPTCAGGRSVAVLIPPAEELAAADVLPAHRARVTDTVKGLVPLAEASDRNTALFVLSMQALEELYSGRCEQQLDHLFWGGLWWIWHLRERGGLIPSRGKVQRATRRFCLLQWCGMRI